MLGVKFLDIGVRKCYVIIKVGVFEEEEWFKNGSVLEGSCREAGRSCLAG